MLALAGLIVVLVCISGFAIWSARSTSQVAERAVSSSILSDHYASAAAAVSAMESLERKYRLEPSPKVLRRYDEASHNLLDVLALVRRDGNENDQMLADRVTNAYSPYRQSIDNMFKAVDLGDTPLVLQIDHDEVDPHFDLIEEIVTKAADAHHSAGLASMAELGAREAFNARATPAVFLLGLALVALFSSVLRRTRAELDAQRKQIEQVQRIAATAFETPEGMFITDAEVNVIKVNNAFTHITGYSEAEMLGNNPHVLSSGGHDASHYAAIWESINITGVWSGDIWDKRKNGQLYPAYLTIAAVKDESGKVTNYVASQTDISDRQKLVEQLRTTAHELEQANAQIEADNLNLTGRVAERTAQLEYANHAKNSFLATMSHEIRTPLGGLMGMMELLHFSELDDKQKDVLNAARESADGLLRIVNDILDWSKIEANKLDLAPSPSTVMKLLQGVRKTYDAIADAKNLNLSLQVDEKLSAAHLFDSLRISQILNNLVSNAIKFTREGAIEIRAESVAQGVDTETVRFSVRDSGIGITPEQQVKLFQQYAQGSPDVARMYGGTGLGLAISHRLAQLMGGKLAVESTANVGSTFSLTIDLPIAIPEERSEQQQLIDKPDRRQSEIDIASLLVDLHHITVLTVDDHPINRILLRQQLELLGVRVEAAETGASALKLWQHGKFDMVITDCHMPEMDGYELTRQIRAIEQSTEKVRIPIIAWTANVLAEEAVRIQSAEMDDMLTKPTEVKILNKMLVKWLEKMPVHEPSTNPNATQEIVTIKATPPVLDVTVLDKLIADHATQIEILKAFNAQNPADISALKLTLQGPDSVAIANAAHRIKGASGTVGAKQLEVLCAAINDAAKKNDMATIKAAAVDMDEVVKGLDEEITRFIKQKTKN
jgi:two-component system sensor histidine kinase EvgS